jgi:SPP1 gp7 family putative phage head morphogenesis protein
MKEINEHIHNGEQYPLEIKDTMDNVENRMARKVSSTFSKWNYPVFQWAIGVIQDIYGQNQVLKKNDEKLLVPTKKEILKELLTMVVIEDFLIDNDLLATSMMTATGFAFNNLMTETGGKQMMDTVLGAMNISFDIQYDMNLYNKILAERKEWLAEKLYDTTIDEIPKIISSGIENGLTIDEMTKQLEDVLCIDKDRATKIARTETNYTANEAIREQTHRLGVEKYRISTAVDACDICNMSSQVEYTYRETADLLPIHPNCRCILQSIIPNEWFKIQKSIENRKVEERQNNEEIFKNTLETTFNQLKELLDKKDIQILEKLENTLEITNRALEIAKNAKKKEERKNNKCIS